MVGTDSKVSLEAPFNYMTKANIVTLAAELEFPLKLTWSCYKGGLTQCGVCPTCRERIGAFHEAGYHDPTTYLTPLVENSEWLDWPYATQPTRTRS